MLISLTVRDALATLLAPDARLKMGHNKSIWPTITATKDLAMVTLATIHELLSTTVWMFFLIVGVWGTYRALRGQGMDGNFLGSVAVGQILYYVQGLLGVLIWFAGNSRPGNGFMHWLYGSFALVFLPFVYFVWLRSDDSNRAQWVMGFATLFMFGITLRLITTGV